MDGAAAVSLGPHYPEPDEAVVAPLAAVADAAARLVEQERWRLAAIVESAHDAIIGADSEGRILTWNRGAEQLFGHGGDAVVGRHLSLIVAPSERTSLERVLDRVRTGELQRHHETVGVRANGLAVDLSVTASPICDDDRALVGISVIARDVTEQRWMARTLTTTLESLEAALAEARDSESTGRRFLGDAAHQLRTPIAGIRAAAEGLLLNPSPARREALLADVIRETGRAGRLMTGLLRVARLDQGHTLTPRRTDLVDVCAGEVARVGALAPHLTVAVTAGNGVDTHAEVDGPAVREILANLLDNSRRHAKGRVDVTVTSRDGTAEITISDDGPGVSPALEGRIFERFASLDGRGGSGLGLPIARGLARAHDGDLTYEGKAFVLRLPVRAAVECGGASRPDFGHPEAPEATEWEDWETP